MNAFNMCKKMTFFNADCSAGTVKFVELECLDHTSYIDFNLLG